MCKNEWMNGVVCNVQGPVGSNDHMVAIEWMKRREREREGAILRGTNFFGLGTRQTNEGNGIWWLACVGKTKRRKVANEITSPSKCEIASVVERVSSTNDFVNEPNRPMPSKLSRHSQSHVCLLLPYALSLSQIEWTHTLESTHEWTRS